MQVYERLLFCYFSSDSYFHIIGNSTFNITQHFKSFSDRFLNICIIIDFIYLFIYLFVHSFIHY